MGGLVLHRLMPVVMALDWLLAPPSRRLAFRQCLWWMIYPLLYLVYSLIRGPIVDWYPYPFLDPDESAGTPGWWPCRSGSPFFSWG